MALAFAGNGTITGLSVGGLPDGTVDADTLASGVGGKVLQVLQKQYESIKNNPANRNLFFNIIDKVPFINKVFTKGNKKTGKDQGALHYTIKST